MSRSKNETHTSTENYYRAEYYEIRIKGHLDGRWSDWFEGLTILQEDNGETQITGLMVDQAALHGVLKKVRDLGMPLVSVNLISSCHPDGSNKNNHNV